MPKALKNCKNCEFLFNEAYNFCPHCGQKAKEQLTLGVLFYNTISNYFSFDARFFKSFLPLLVKPGYLAQKFIEGKRMLYLHPAQMYLFITVVFFFLFSFVTNTQGNKIDRGIADAFNNEKIDSLTIKQKKIIDSTSREEARKTLKDISFLTGKTDKQIDSIVENEKFNTKKNSIGISKKVDSLVRVNAPDEEIYIAMGLKEDSGALKKQLYKQTLKFLKSKKGSSILSTFYDTIPIAMFFILPIFALILKLFYKKSGFYAHHLVFSFYFFTFLFTVFSFVLVVNFILDMPDWLDFLIILSTFGYFIIALKRFYEQHWFKSFLKGSLSVIVFIPVVYIATACVLFFAFMFY